MQQKQISKYLTCWYFKFALKSNLASLKTEGDIEKLVPVTVYLCKLSVVVKNDVVKKNVYDKLVEKVNDIDTSRFVLKTVNETDEFEQEKVLKLLN